MRQVVAGAATAACHLALGPASHPIPPSPPSSAACSDTPKEIKSKVNKYAFSGGGTSVEEHRAKGALPACPLLACLPGARGHGLLSACSGTNSLQPCVL